MVCVQAYIPVLEWASTWEIVADVFGAKKEEGPRSDSELATWIRDEFEGKLNGPCDLCPLPGGAVCEPRERGKALWEM